MKKYIILLACLAITFTGCDDDTTMGELEAPSIDITSPVTSAGVLHSGDDIEMDLSITDSDGLSNVVVSISRSYMHDAVYDGIVFQKDFQPAATTLQIDEAYTIDTAHHSNFWFYVIADDEEGNRAKDSVKVHVHM